MFFGPKFYLKLKALSPWQQSLFAFALAVRQQPNLTLCCQLEDNEQVLASFEEAKACVQTFHEDKFNHVDLSEVALNLEALLPPLSSELSLGQLYLQDALLCLQCACEAIFLHEGEEAEAASNLSLGGVLRRLEAEGGQEVDEESLHDHPLVEAELDFQLQLLKMLESRAARAELGALVLDLTAGLTVSNIGISA